MYGRGLGKISLLTGLLLLAIVFGILSWTMQSPGEHVISIRRVRPSTIEHIYVYVHEHAEIKFVFHLPPEGICNLGISKVGGEWSYTKEIMGIDYIEVELPIKGVYEIWIEYEVHGEEAPGEITISLETRGKFNPKVFIHFVTAIGLALVLISLERGRKNVT